VNTPVAYIGKPGEVLPASAAPKAPSVPVAASKAPDPAPVAVTAAPVATTPVAVPAAPRPAVPVPRVDKRLLISPRAKALASAKVIDPSPIHGTGPNGRITSKDVRAYLATMNYDQLRISPGARTLATKESIDLLKVKGTGMEGRIMVHDVERAVAEKPKTMSKMRQVIARRLTESFTGTPHFYVTVSADMTGLLAYRKELKAQGTDYTVTDFILEAVILSLKEFPAVNSSTDGVTTRWRGSVDLGMAVSLDEGLVVPVIRNAEDLSLSELHDTVKVLAVRAREGKLLPDQMTGSSFTVSNMGMLGVNNFNAIINPGEAAILAVASTIEQPVVRNGAVVVRSIMQMTLSADHRIVDGAMGANFVNAIKNKLEDVELWKRLT
jgi:pyruvate dehydrogenase E2 component (dihydrolipoamide acetyltransferase)